MKTSLSLSRRAFLATTGVAVGAAAIRPGRAASIPDVSSLRREIVDSPLRVGLHRAKVFTKVFQATENEPWVLRKGKALREYFQTVPLYLRPGAGMAGSISEAPGAMPVMVELGIGENGTYTSERPDRKGYLTGQVPAEIRDYWKNRNLFGRYRTEILGLPPFKSADEVPQTLDYKFISNQGHLSPSYRELLKLGIGGLLAKVRGRLAKETNVEPKAFLAAAEQSLLGLSEWTMRYAELAEMRDVCRKIATKPPETFREAMQLIWLAHQAIHVEGHGFSCTPDRIDQLLYPYYEADKKAGRLDDDQVRGLIRQFVLRMYDNGVWGPEHHLTQGLCLAGSTADGRDQTNRLSWLFVEAATELSLPEPLIWIRWHPNIDQDFFDFCLSRLPKSTCFPMMWNDQAVPAGFMELGVERDDAFDYVAVGCNELAIPGKCYFNPCAHVGYLGAIRGALTDAKKKPHESFQDFAAAVGSRMRQDVAKSYENNLKTLDAQMKWGQTPLTSCFFDGCIEQGRDMAQGTKYNVLSCGGAAFANAVDCLAAVRHVVFEKRESTLDEVAKACEANFKGFERLRAKLQAAPKHGNDDPRLDDVIRLLERMRDDPVKRICRDPRDGRPFGNSHVVRSVAVKQGQVTPATPDGRLAGTPLASSMASSAGCERNGPTAVLNSVCKLNAAKSWQCGYQVNLRFQPAMASDPVQRKKLRAMLNVYFAGGGQELQINVVDSATLRAAQKNPDQYRDLVVRVAGFSEFFVNLTPDMQEEILARAEH